MPILNMSRLLDRPSACASRKAITSSFDCSMEEELGYTRSVPDAAWTELWDFHEQAPVLNGPVLIELTSAVSMAVGAKCNIDYRSAEE